MVRSIITTLHPIMMIRLLLTHFTHPELFLPLTMMNRLKILKNQLWSFQDAIVYVFYEYLSKREKLRSCSIDLDKRLPSRNNNYSSNYRKCLIQYASYDCLSLMELIMFVHENYLCRRSVNDLSIQFRREYSSYLSTKFISFSLAERRSVCDILLSDESDDSMAVHDLDECHQLSLDVQRNQQHRNINHYCQAFELEYDINQSRPAFEQFYKNNHCLTTGQELTNYQSINQANSPNYINNHSYQPNSHQDLAMNDDSQLSSLNANCLSLQSKRKPRSTAAHKCRNQKSSLRHGKNRYRFELIRPVNTTITNVKRLLHAHAVHYLNANIVKSTFYIDLKSQELQNYYDHLLPMDSFT